MYTYLYVKPWHGMNHEILSLLLRGSPTMVYETKWVQKPAISKGKNNSTYTSGWKDTPAKPNEFLAMEPRVTSLHL